VLEIDDRLRGLTSPLHVYCILGISAFVHQTSIGSGETLELGRIGRPSSCNANGGLDRKGSAFPGEKEALIGSGERSQRPEQMNPSRGCVAPTAAETLSCLDG
jgi:hypothetical protein